MYREEMKWPGGNRCAVLVTVNLNAELFWLRRDPAAAHMPKTLSMGQYGMSRGLERVLEALEAREIKGTFFTPGRVAELYPEKLALVKEQGHEIAAMSYGVENMGLLSREEQAEAIEKTIKAIERHCGVTPAGFRAPEGELTLGTLQAAKQLGMRYSSNLSDDDRPYLKDLGDGDSLLEIPIHWALYDLPYFAFNYNPACPAGQGRIANYTGVLNNWKDEFQGCYEYGLCCVLQLDPQAIGNPGRIALLEELLDHMKSKEGVWFATGSQTAEYMGDYLERKNTGRK